MQVFLAWEFSSWDLRPGRHGWLWNGELGPAAGSAQKKNKKKLLTKATSNGRYYISEPKKKDAQRKFTIVTKKRLGTYLYMIIRKRKELELMWHPMSPTTQYIGHGIVSF